LIGKHPDICAPVAPHFLDFFYSKLRYYGDLSKYENMSVLLNDCKEVANHKYHDWNLTIDSDELYKKYRPFNLSMAIDALYMEKSRSEGKTGYFSKGIGNYRYAHYIKQTLPGAKFIYLHRDPRGNVASWLKKPLYLHTVYDIAKKWNAEQNIAINLLNIYPNEIFRVSYEALVSDTVGAMTNLQRFLNLEINEQCFTTDAENKESNWNPFWENLNKPIQSENISKYKKYLSEKDLLIVESLSKENMILLGYNNFHTSANWDGYKRDLFQAKEVLRRRYSKWKNRKFRKKEMEKLQDKMLLGKKILNRLKKNNII
jgi:hypothetical protein